MAEVHLRKQNLINQTLGKIHPNPFRSFEEKANTHDKLILSLVPEGTPMAGATLYETLLNASCFVASLSDGKALRMAQDIGG